MTEMTEERQTGWVADDSTFGARLALVRQRMGWGNVKEAAIECGLPPESWRRWERDNRAPRNAADIAWQIAEVTGADYGWLLDPRTRRAPLATRVLERRRQPTAHYPIVAGQRHKPPDRPIPTSPAHPISPLNHTAASHPSGRPERRTRRIDRRDHGE